MHDCSAILKTLKCGCVTLKRIKIYIFLMPMFSGELKSILWYSPADGRDIKVPQDGFHAPKALATIKYRFLKKKKTFWCDRTKPGGVSSLI